MILLCLTLLHPSSLVYQNKLSEATTPAEAERATRSLHQFLGVLHLPVPSDVPRISARTDSSGLRRLEIQFRRLGASIDSKSGDILGITLKHERDAKGKALSKEEVLKRAQRIVKNRLPDKLRHLYSCTYTPAGSPNLDISKSHGIYYITFRELAGRLPTIDPGNFTALEFNAVTGNLQGYHEVRGFTKVGPEKPTISVAQARDIVAKLLTGVMPQERIIDVVLGWAAPDADKIAGIDGHQLILCYDVRTDRDSGYRVDAVFGKYVGTRSSAQCLRWKPDLRGPRKGR